jgi:hypothetical protein
MQDYRTGAMTELKPEVMAGIPDRSGNFKQRLKDLMRDSAFVKRAGEQSGIPVEHQGPVFEISEEVVLKGAKFRVRGFEGGLLHLQGLPKVPDTPGLSNFPE